MTVEPLSSTGCHASPTCCSISPKPHIAPTISPAATATSAITTKPKPRFLTRLVSLAVNADVEVLTDSVADLTSSSFSVVLVKSVASFTLLNAPRAVAKPANTYTAFVARETLSTPLQSPDLIASQFSLNSETIPVRPTRAPLAPAKVIFLVAAPIAIPTSPKPRIAVHALSMSFSVSSSDKPFTPLIISVIP